MTKILLNSRGFVIEVIFSHILPFSYRGKKFSRRKMTKFWLGEENFPWQKILHHQIFPEKVIVFPNQLWRCQKYPLLSIFMERSSSVCLKSIFTYIVDLAFIGQITFSQHFENDWNKNVDLKIILIVENSFLQMYCNKIKSFWKSSVYSLVIEV